MSFIERFVILCPLFGVAFIGGSMALLMLRSSGFHGSPYAKELRVPWLSLC